LLLRVNMSPRLYGRTKICLNKSLHPCLHKGLPSNHGSPLGCFSAPHW
jgi:hypothetical protein